jgi:hypothetical protein
MFSRTAIPILLAFPTALVVALAPAAHADVFDMCPGGHVRNVLAAGRQLAHNCLRTLAIASARDTSV